MTTRRSFTEICTHVLGGLITAALSGLGATYLLTPAKGKRSTGWAEAANTSKLKAGEAEEVVFERVRVDGWRVIREKNSAWDARSGMRRRKRTSYALAMCRSLRSTARCFQGPRRARWTATT
jgi:hypothetical protein